MTTYQINITSDNLNISTHVKNQQLR